MQIEFPVQNIPPKKGSGTSMWSNSIEVPKIIALREKALEEMKKVGLSQCFLSSVKLELTIFAQERFYSRTSGYYMGDLDTLIAGICDGLQAADQNTPLAHELIQRLENTEIDPRRKLLIHDDTLIMSIIAKKMIIADDQQINYKVTVESV
jgi:hypothetical protein